MSLQRPKRYVFAHFMMGNTYPYKAENFQKDIVDAISTGIDGFALNLGQDEWTPARIQTFFDVAHLFPSFKLFFSFDMSIITSASVIVEYVLRYANHPNSFIYRGQRFVSTFAGENQTFGHADVNTGWDLEVKRRLKEKGVDICFVPSWTGVDAWDMFRRFPVVDGAFSWAAWPFPDKDTPRKYDRAYVQTGRQLGKIYMAGVSPCFFAHFPWKNWVYPDMALLVKRFQELVKLQPEFIQIISWNDWGESHYIGKLQNEAGIPEGAEKWIAGFNHEPWREICKYFIKAYRSGGYVAVDEDELICWYPPHLNCHTQPCHADPTPCPANAHLFQSKLVAAVFLKGTIREDFQGAEIVLQSGDQECHFKAVPGLNLVEMKLSPGKQQARLSRKGQIILRAEGDMDVTETRQGIWNYNLYVMKSSGYP